MPQGPDRLVTGEAVALDLRLAALPSRAVAAGVDLLGQAVLLLGVFAAATVSSVGVSQAAGAALGIVALVLVLIVAPVAFETLLRGRTPGKAVMGLRVVRDDGGPIGFRQALVRGLSGAFLEKFGVSFYSLGVVVSLGNSRHKRIGDLLAGTVVVQERLALADPPMPAMPPPLAAWATTLELTGLSDALALSVRSFVARSPQLTAATRQDLGGRLVAAVRGVTTPPPPPGTPGWAYLAAVLAERRRRELLRLGGARPAPQGSGRNPVQAPGPPPVTAPAPAPAPAPVPAPRTGGFAPPG